MRPLRILFFTNFVHEQGTYFRFHNLAVALSRLGQRVEVCGLDHDTKAKRRTESRDGIRYTIVPSVRGLSHISAFVHPLNPVRMRWFADPSPCDVAHLFQPFPAASGAWHGCRAKAKFYDWDDLWVGGLMAGRPTSVRAWVERALTRRGEHWLPRAADHVTTCGSYLHQQALARGARRVSVLFNGLWPSPPANKAEARRALGLAPDACYVGFMGRTCNELGWIFEAIRANLSSWPALRLTLCGAPAGSLDGLEPELRARIDHLGQISPARAAQFAAALDLGLIPLDDTPFNRSRFPIKYAEHMAAGVPVLCSEIGECGRLSAQFAWVITAGKSKDAWLRAFGQAMPQLHARTLPVVNLAVLAETFSWDGIGAELLGLYREEMLRQVDTGLV